MVECPHGHSENLQYSALVRQYQTVDSQEDGRLVLGEVDETWDHDEPDPQMFCRDCAEHFTVPDGIELDFD